MSFIGPTDSRKTLALSLCTPKLREADCGLSLPSGIDKWCRKRCAHLPKPAFVQLPTVGGSNCRQHQRSLSDTTSSRTLLPKPQRYALQDLDLRHADAIPICPLCCLFVEIHRAVLNETIRCGSHVNSKPFLQQWGLRGHRTIPRSKMSLAAFTESEHL
jgi:hypothetical protein